jgi:predicted PurR-regulated permease PerM
MSSKFTFNRELVIRSFFFTAFAFLLYQLFRLARPFIPSLLVATMLTLTFYPLYKRLRRSVRNPNIASLILTFGVLLSAVLPLLGLAWVLIRESGNLIPAAQSAMESLHSGEFGGLRDRLPSAIVNLAERVADYLSRVNIDVKPMIIGNLQDVGAKITEIGGFIAANAVFTFFRLVILLIALFFMFRDGESFFNWILSLIPMETGHKIAVARSAYETFRAVTIGVFLTAAAQGIVAMIGFLFAGVRLPVILGIATGAASLLGASFLVTIPAALIVMMDRTGTGWFLLFWGMIAVGWLDNFLKPILIGSRARMPFVLVFFSILGGLKAYGLLGLILGPILVASVLAFVRIYREAYGASSPAE